MFPQVCICLCTGGPHVTITDVLDLTVQAPAHPDISPGDPHGHWNWSKYGF